jgi:hypothetical protein
MSRPACSIRSLLAALFIALTLVIDAGCSGSSEQPLLNQFFMASRLRDTTSLNNMTMVLFEPGTQGTVSSFKVVSVTPEERKPLPLKALASAHEAAKADNAAFTKRKETFQNENLETIQRLLRADREKGRIRGKDAEVQAAWSKFLQDGVAVSRKVSDAKRKLASESGVVDLSINAGARAPVDITKHDGELISKDVMIDAVVKLPSGETTNKTFVITMQRAILKTEREITGRWIIAAIKDTAAPPAIKTS